MLLITMKPEGETGDKEWLLKAKLRPYGGGLYFSDLEAHTSARADFGDLPWELVERLEWVYAVTDDILSPGTYRLDKARAEVSIPNKTCRQVIRVIAPDLESIQRIYREMLAGSIPVSLSAAITNAGNLPKSI